MISLGLSARARTAAQAALEFLLPIACVSCERLLDPGERGIVCGRCWSRVSALPYPQCERCGHPTAGRKCQFCILLPPFVRCARSCVWMPGGEAGAIVYALKYGGWSRTADEIARRISRLHWPADVVEERRAIIPVPLTSARRRERGYNQSELLASSLEKLWRCPAWSDALVRTRSTSTQTVLTPEERRRNVAGAFQVPPQKRQQIRGAHLIIIDDVMTTSATLNACAASLYDAGARTLSYVTFGRARAAGDKVQSL
jgi:ComF family protein